MAHKFGVGDHVFVKEFTHQGFGVVPAGTTALVISADEDGCRVRFDHIFYPDGNNRDHWLFNVRLERIPNQQLELFTCMDSQ